MAKSHFRGKKGRNTWVNNKGNIALDAVDNLATCFNGHIKSNGLHLEPSFRLRHKDFVPETSITIDCW